MQVELFEHERLARSAAEDANRAKDEFLAMVSHELRNPLSSILGWTSVLKARQMPLESAGHAFEVIERNARLEAQLVESLLDVSRIAAGKLILDSERVDLVSLLQLAVDSARPAADSKEINLEISAPSELALVGRVVTLVGSDFLNLLYAARRLQIQLGVQHTIRHGFRRHRARCGQYDAGGMLRRAVRHGRSLHDE